MSLMRKHRERVLAQQAGTLREAETEAVPESRRDKAEQAPTGLTGWRKDHNQQMAGLSLALSQLAGLNSKSARAQLKRDELLPQFLPYLERYREAGQDYDNPVLTRVVIWLFDINDLDAALEWGFYAIERKQAMPDDFNRDVATFMADQVIDWAEQQHKAGHSIEPYFSRVFEKVVNEWHLFERISARYYKLAGLVLMNSEQRAEQEHALEYFRRATELHPKIGVGTRIAQLEKKLDSET